MREKNGNFSNHCSYRPGGYACGFIKARELSALRKEMKLYVDRMEAAELDLHAIRSVAEHRLHGAGKQLPTFTAVSTVQL